MHTDTLTELFYLNTPLTLSFHHLNSVNCSSSRVVVGMDVELVFKNRMLNIC